MNATGQAVGEELGKALDAFVAGLKERLAALSPDDIIIEGGDRWAGGSTEAGFCPDDVVDMDRLNAEIDAFCAEFNAKR